jgi:GNAT superfamily N-acetyltransferase
MEICEKLGKDNLGHPWIVTVDEEIIPLKRNTCLTHFLCYSAYLAPKRRVNSPAYAIVTAKSSTVAELGYIWVNAPKQSDGIGSLLINYVEQWMATKGTKLIYGYISDDPELYQYKFPNLKSYLKELRRFYTRKHWTWQLFGAKKPKSVKNPHAIGRVEKRIL